MWYRENATVRSKSIYDASGTITKATLQSTRYNAANSTITLYLSADNGNNWEDVISGTEHTFANPGTNLKWRADLTHATGGYLNDTSFLFWANVSVPKGYPTNISVDFGDDGIDDFTFIGELNSSNSPMIVNVTSGNISGSSILSGYDHLLQVPMKITSGSVGQINMDAINITYNPNPIKLYLDAIITYISNFTNFGVVPISIESNGGNITVDDVRLDYAGGNDTIGITARNNDSSINITRNITFFYSKWDYEWVPLDVEWIYFSPLSPTAKNVTPYGQTEEIPLFNITNYGYGERNATLSLYVNDSLECVNMTLSLTENKTDGFISIIVIINHA